MSNERLPEGPKCPIDLHENFLFLGMLLFALLIVKVGHWTGRALTRTAEVTCVPVVKRCLQNNETFTSKASFSNLFAFASRLSDIHGLTAL